MGVHLKYIKEALVDNKGEHREIIDKFEAYIDKTDKNHASNIRVDALEKKIIRLETIVFRAIVTAVLAVISNLATIVYFLLNNFVVK